MKTKIRQKKAAYLAFALLGVIWGSNFIFMKWAAEDISPSQIVLLRVVFGFLPIFFFAASEASAALGTSAPHPSLRRHGAPGHSDLLLRFCQGNGASSVKHRGTVERRDPFVHIHLCLAVPA